MVCDKERRVETADSRAGLVVPCEQFDQIIHLLVGKMDGLELNSVSARTQQPRKELGGCPWGIGALGTSLTSRVISALKLGSDRRK